MSESMKDQLEKFTKAGGLQTSTPGSATTNQIQLAEPAKTHLIKPVASSYEALILEIDKLRTKNAQLTQEISVLKENPNNILSQLKDDLSAAVARAQAAAGANRELARENLQLKQELTDLPTQDEVSHWRSKVREAEAQESELQLNIKKLEEDRQQLVSDRLAFEDEFERLGKLDEAAARLAADQRALAESEVDVRKRQADAEKAESQLAVERARLDELDADLHALQARVGPFRKMEQALEALTSEHTRISRLYEAGKTRVRNLTEQRDEAIQAASDAEGKTKKINRELKDAINKLAAMPDGEVVIRSFETVQWLVSQFNDPDEIVIPKQVLLIGEGPWPVDNFTELLQELGFEVWQNGFNADIEIVIVGRNNWSEEVVDAQIEGRNGESLRMYPQELFVLLLAMQADPLELANADDLLKFVDRHPVFEYLFNQEFPWPETKFEDGPPVTIGEGFDSENASSPLYEMGYTVAQNAALTPTQRHEVLKAAYAEMNLPWCISEEYMEDWGDANSRKRLRRIAWHLHLMTKRFRRHTEAVTRWESDLEWLKRTHYKPIHRFRWPT